MTPLENYQAKLATHAYQKDPQQLIAIQILDILYHALHKRYHPSLLDNFLPKKMIKGLYLCGSVGIGKTFLLDIFFECADFPKLRMHFFTFMRYIHAELKKYQGQKNPLTLIAKEIAKKTSVICFDEFFVSDIADAMILGELFQVLFKAGIVLITTSNTRPDDLYKHGLQRERFLPAIAAIKKNTTIIQLATQVDYRLYHQKPAGVYFSPIDATEKIQMQNAFSYYSHAKNISDSAILVNEHLVPIIQKSEDVLWCDFKALCVDDRSQNDYLDIAKRYHTVLIDHIPATEKQDKKAALRFVYLIDILYDAHVRVIISAEKSPDGICNIERTVSRLMEMQSKNYFDMNGRINS